jgi:hypothetical protein
MLSCLLTALTHPLGVLGGDLLLDSLGQKPQGILLPEFPVRAAVRLEEMFLMLELLGSGAVAHPQVVVLSELL